MDPTRLKDLGWEQDALDHTIWHNENVTMAMFVYVERNPQSYAIYINGNGWRERIVYSTFADAYDEIIRLTTALKLGAKLENLTTYSWPAGSGENDAGTTPAE